MLLTSNFNDRMNFHKCNIFAGSHLERKLINVKGTCHVFHPPSDVTMEQLELQATSKPPEPKLQLDWVYLF